MSASYTVDLYNTCQAFQSVPSISQGADAGLAITSGGCISSLSGVLMGDVWDGINADTYTNIYVTGKPLGSGPLLVGVQTSDSTTSGTFTDPTSGLAALPVNFNSGGFLILGSGPATSTLLGIFGSGVSGQYFLSGFMTFGAFQRPHRYARLYFGAGGFADGYFQAGFIGQYRTTGSGGGFTLSPSSGAVEV